MSGGASELVDPAGRPFRSDGLQNVLTGLLTQYDSRLATMLVASSYLQQPEIDELYGSDPIAAKVVEKPARDATRRWFDLRGEAREGMAEDWPKRSLDALEDLQAPTILSDYLAKNRKDGGALLLLNVDDGVTDLSLPLDLAKVLRLRSLDLLERWGVNVVRDTDPASMTYGKPLYYAVFGRGLGTKVHVSRVCALHGVSVSVRQDAQQSGWGASELQRPRESLLRWSELWAYVETTFKHFSHQVLKMADLGRLLEAGQDLLVQQRLAVMGQYLSTIGIVPIDATDSLEEKSVTFGGVAEMLRVAQDRVASATGMPVTMLFGHAPAGLSTDDASGRANWQDYVSDIQARQLRPAINRILDVLLASSEGPTSGVLPMRYQVDFRPLDAPTDGQISERRYRDAQTDGIYLQLGALSIESVQARLRADPSSPYDIDGPEADLSLPDESPSEGDETDLAVEAPPSSATPAASSAPAAGVAPPEAPSALAKEPPNGAQIAQAVDIVKSVAKREISPSGGIAMLVDFCGFTETRAIAQMGGAGVTFFADGVSPPVTADEQAEIDAEPKFTAEELRTLMPIKDVQAILGIGRTRIEHLADAGELKAKRVAGLWRFDPKSVHEYLAGAEHQVETPKTDATDGSVVVSIPIPPELARLWPIDGRNGDGDNSPPHFTVLYLPKVEADDRVALLQSLERVLTDWGPIGIRLSESVETFESSEPGRMVHAMGVQDATEIRALHRALLAMARGLGIEASQYSGPRYRPHSTLTYTPKGVAYGGAIPSGAYIVGVVDVVGLGPDRRIAMAR